MQDDIMLRCRKVLILCSFLNLGVNLAYACWLMIVECEQVINISAGIAKFSCYRKVGHS